MVHISSKVFNILVVVSLLLCCFAQHYIRKQWGVNNSVTMSSGVHNEGIGKNLAFKTKPIGNDFPYSFKEYANQILMEFCNEVTEWF